ncbi:iron(III) dicitrate transport system, periplasmic iron-binding protein FecB [Streptomyces sp. L-9-10]|uniref:ABC transporter substrate-binding protein n=1 Tax=unclassified Streptomyces TaxID=2593676 RepID=UPI00101C1081|nr:iron-siderophore ABC transporter substrate-binding protein [Streptomyces sp. L-9-10]RYJ21956.1 iron(III) dicitrate transport system, periplasmic iron-binding protein FecB [Streptomyces sp. L-9-10]
MSSTFTRRRITGAAAATALAVTLAGCGGGDKAADKGGEAADGGAGTHTVTTVMGEVKVGDAPKRVVVLDTDALDSAVTLGITPVGATTVVDKAPFSTYLPEDKLKGIQPVGLIAEPNLEAIAALKPDLILSSKVRDEKNYESLSAIAPTVFSDTTGPTWRKNFDLHADALGRKNEAKKVVADYDAHVKRLTDALGGAAKAKRTKVGFVRFVEGADTRLYLNDTFVGSLFKDLQVGRPANQDTTGFSADVSPEQIDKANADVIFYSTYGDAKKAKETDTVGGPLWKNLDAVKKGTAFKVDDNLWMLGIGYTGAGRVLDAMEKSFAAAAS